MTEIAVRFLRNYCQYSRGDMATIPADELQRLVAKGFVAPIERQAPIETATEAAPETAVTRNRGRRG